MGFGLGEREEKESYEGDEDSVARRNKIANFKFWFNPNRYHV